MRILLAITSSISAYKTPFLVSHLKKQGHNVICAVTKNAQNMVGAKALETMSGNKVITDLWQEDDILRHIHINEETDVLLIAPADVNIIGKIANGICDDAISTIACAYTKKKYFAPAMNPNMWANKANQRNVKYLIEELNYELISPESGEMACNDTGVGRLADIDTIIQKVTSYNKSLKYNNIRFTITSGATIEWIDPIRYITNNSSGKMGASIYEEISSNGGISAYIEGKVNEPLSIKSNDKKIKVNTTKELQDNVLNELDNTDILIMAAAPLDFRPAQVFDKKVKKHNINTIELIENDDILLSAKNRKKNQTVIVSFAAETAENDEELKNYALDKMNRKDADMIVANKIKDAIGKDTNKITIFFKDGRFKSFPVLNKKECAKEIVSEAVSEWNKKNNITGLK
ncbi:bifunctional phosphopantothenoylcysteine decarboxylase/phosphopantothenate--cysteine ligase CoaBC [Brachyspira hampsonii]|uniref:bifunctional phosphopantothenoylcysteine decarboxylase/phosphopantothenate--cysteine ligase CoaBC n=1 Tax=Brachyspira hampsonii TaxID=1287055 RepID=UPI000D34E01A|nr:bifunctional phosphopantothenoylcysteine decarboxylase/phosphopantothenate--cysteine ligase CoaBC [Brachyspira hampsonii]PTY41287.1 phosphopantothenoylcysteine decarboxylase [Brachyspira hampsonii bv. II]